MRSSNGNFSVLGYRFSQEKSPSDIRGGAFLDKTQLENSVYSSTTGFGDQPPQTECA